MKHTIALACLALAVSAPGAGSAQTAPGGLPPGTRLLAPITFKQLTILPLVKVVANSADNARYLTLSEGLKAKKVAVSERKEGASVNQVLVANHSDRSLLLLGGEVILGGQQDRIIGKDTIIEPHEQRTVGVFCVEHGRWNGGRQFTEAGGMAEGKMRVSAKFRSNQQAVWDDVAKKNAALGAATGNSSGTYRRLAAGHEGQKVVKAYRDAILPALEKLPEKQKVVGVVAAVNGKVTSADVFATPELFAAYREKLLDSIFITAADVAPTAGAEKAPTLVEVGTFFRKADTAPERTVVDGKAARTVENLSDDVAGSKVRMKAAPPAATPVYQSVQSTK